MVKAAIFLIFKLFFYRLLRVLCCQMMLQRYNMPIDQNEEQLQVSLERLNANLLAPDRLKVCFYNFFVPRGLLPYKKMEGLNALSVFFFFISSKGKKNLKNRLLDI